MILAQDLYFIMQSNITCKIYKVLIEICMCKFNYLRQTFLSIFDSELQKAGTILFFVFF